MTTEEFLKLDLVERFEQSIQVMKDTKTIWLLKNHDGRYTVSYDDCGCMMLCVWGDDNHARYNCRDEWKDTTPTALSFDDFISKIFPILGVGIIKSVFVSYMGEFPGMEISIADFFEKLGIEYVANDEEEVCDEPKISAPIDIKLLYGLFGYLKKKLGTEGCKNDLRLSVAYLKENGVENLDEVVDWLKSNGGYCDCEVLMNVEPQVR